MAKKKTPVVKKPKTYVAIILDRSGSMARTKESAIVGFNEQVQQLKEDSKDQEILCSLVTFNGEVFEHLWNVPADQLAEADPKDYIPSGKTAMKDAIGYTVQKLLNTTDHNDPNTAYLIVTISDGESWDDQHYVGPCFTELTEGVQATKRWTFTYVGCDPKYMREIARQTHTPVSNMAAWDNGTAGGASAGFKNIRSRQKKYFAERGMGQTAAANYASDLAGAVADFTKEAYEAAPAPVLLDPESFCPMRANLLDNMPKYAVQESLSYNGGSLFANSQKVAWTEEAKVDLATNHARPTSSAIWKG